MSPPRVSICIPAYRQIEFLKKAFDSLLVQTYRDYEVVVTDDSPDESVEQLIGLYKGACRLRYHRNASRLGSPANWNAAVSLANGQYIKILHHDDWFADGDSLGHFVQMLDSRPDADFAFSATEIYSQSGHLVRTHCATEAQRATLYDCPETLIMTNFIGAPSATIYRKAASPAYDERLKWLVDVDFYIRVLRTNPNHVFSPVALVCTPTGVAHQVTEECYANPRVELVEQALVLAKHYEKAAQLPDLVSFWRDLLARYRIWSRKRLDAVAAPPERLDRFFEEVFRAPIWLRAITLAVIGIAQRPYMALPEGVKNIWRSFKRMLSSVT